MKLVRFSWVLTIRLNCRSEFFAPRPTEFFELVANSSKPFTKEQIKQVYSDLIDKNPKKEDLVNALYDYEMELKKFTQEMREKKEQAKAQEQFFIQQFKFFTRENCEPNC